MAWRGVSDIWCSAERKILNVLDVLKREYYSSDECLGYTSLSQLSPFSLHFIGLYGTFNSDSNVNISNKSS